VRRIFLTAVLLGSCATLAYAAETSDPVTDPGAFGAFEQVESIPALGGLHSWQAVDERSLIVWANAFQPYLIELAMPSHDLRFARAVGVSSFGSRIHARFDAVHIDGVSYRIDRIYKISREEARSGSFVW
jgi:hypothetical protein